MTNASPVASAEGYFPLRLCRLRPGKPLFFDLYFEVPGLNGCDRHLVLSCRKGKIFQDKLLGSDEGRKSWAYFPSSEAAAVLRYFSDNVEEFLRKPSLLNCDKIAFLYDISLTWVENFFTAPASQAPDNIKFIITIIERIPKYLLDEKNLAKLLCTVRRHDSHLYTHTINVFLISMAFSLFKGWSVEESRELGLACLLHDIGMTSLPHDITQKPERLTDIDRHYVKNHPGESKKLLAKIPLIPERVLAVVAQHHENYDGSGYPQGLAAEAIHPWARILRIIDSFESLTSIRPWRPPCNTSQALAVMKSTLKGKEVYDPVLLAEFIGFLQQG